MNNKRYSVKEGVSTVLDLGGMVLGAALILPFLVYADYKQKAPITNPLFDKPSLKFVQTQLSKANESERQRMSWAASWNDSPLLSSPRPSSVSPYYNSDISHNKEVLLREGINLAAIEKNYLLINEFNSQLDELRQNQLKMGRWIYGGEVMADLHNHFSTSHKMDGLLDKILNKITRSRKSPAILGVIDFNNFGKESRFEQLRNQAKDRAYDFNNSLYFPIQDVILIKGQEVPTKEGHLLVLGLNRNDELKPGRFLDDSLKEAKDHNGITIVDHPFSPHGGLGPFLLDNRDYLHRFDAWEVFNAEASIFRGANKKADIAYRNEIEENYNIGALSGTDGHSIYEIGKSSTLLNMPAYNSFNSSEDVTNSLRNAIKSKRDYSYLGSVVDHTKKPSRIGALDHMADLAAIIALSKVGIPSFRK